MPTVKEMKQAMKVLQEGLEQGQVVSLKGFGKFVLQRKEARNGRNPATGEAITIPDKTVIKFQPTNSFKQKIAELEVVETPEDEDDSEE